MRPDSPVSIPSRRALGATLLALGSIGTFAAPAFAGGGPSAPTPLPESPVRVDVGCEQYLVPDGVTSINFEVVGSSGNASDPSDTHSGRGARITGTWPTSAGSIIWACTDMMSSGTSGGGGDDGSIGGGLSSLGTVSGNSGIPEVIAGGGGAAGLPDPDVASWFAAGGNAGLLGQAAQNGSPGPGSAATGGGGANGDVPGAAGFTDTFNSTSVIPATAGLSFTDPMYEAGGGGTGASGTAIMVNALFGGGGGGGLAGGGGGGAGFGSLGAGGGGGSSACEAPAISCQSELASTHGFGYVVLTYGTSEGETPSGGGPVSTPTEPTTTPAPPAPTDTGVTPTPPVAPAKTETRPAAPSPKIWGVELVRDGDQPGGLPTVTATRTGSSPAATAVRLPLGCPATATGCDASGLLTMDARAGAGARTAAVRQTVLARFRGVEIEAGKSKLVKVHLSRATVARLQAQGVRKVRATLTIDNHLDGGPTVRTRQNVTLRIPRAQVRQATPTVAPSFTG